MATYLSSDLLLIQRGSDPKRTTYGEISESIRGDLDVTFNGDIPIASAAQLGVIRVGSNLDIDPATGILDAVIPAGLEYMGTWDQTGAVPPSPANGQFWVWNGADGAILSNALWGSINGSTVNAGDRLFYDGTNWSIVPGGGAAGLTQVTGTAPIQVSAIANGEQNISITEASGTDDGYLTSELWNKIDGIEPGAEANVDPTQTYTAAADQGTLTLTPGGDTTIVPVATSTFAGLMSADDKAQLDSLVATPGGVVSFEARHGLTNNGTASAPVVDVDFGGVAGGTDLSTLTVMPADISKLEELV